MSDLHKFQAAAAELGLKFKAHDGDTFELEGRGLYYQLEGDAIVGVAVRNVRIDDFSFLEPLDGLISLSLHSINNNNIPPLGRHKALRKLHLEHNKLTDLDCLEGLTGLTHLVLNNNRLVDLAPVARLTALESLSARGNKLKGLPDLSPLTRLRRLDLRYNKLKDLCDLLSLKGAGALAHLELSSAAETLVFTGPQVPALFEILEDNGDAYMRVDEVELSAKERRALKAACADLESLAPERVSAALEVFNADDKLRRRAEARYLNLIRLLSGDPRATLLDFAAANLTEGLINRVLEGLSKTSIEYGLAEEAVHAATTKLIAAVTRNHIDVDRFFADLEGLSCEGLLQARWIFSERLRAALKQEARLLPSGWFGKLCKALAAAKLKRVLLNHASVEVEDAGFIFFLGVSSQAGPISFDVFQSDLALPGRVWALPHLPKLTVQEGHLSMRHGGKAKGSTRDDYTLRCPKDRLGYLRELGVSVTHAR